MKFPNGLTDLEIEKGMMLPISLTDRLAFKHIKDKVISNIVATKAYLALVNDITNRLYVPNGNGPVQYLQDMKTYHLSAAIVKGGVIDDKFIILYAQHVFVESGHTKERSRFGEEWEKFDTEYKNAQSVVDQLKTQFRRFQNYYNKRLKELYDNRDTGKQHQAHHVSAFETRMTDMEQNQIVLATMSNSYMKTKKI